MKQHSILSTAGIAALLLGTAAVSSCNKETESDLYQDPVNLAVTAFSLKADSDNPGLDSAYFAIDLQRGVIFNADSLRKGTKIEKVVAEITFSSTVSEAVIEMTGGTTREGEIDYKANPTDSIDFTGDVILRVKADDNSIGTSYRIKVNVHNTDSDSLYWDKTAKATLPSRLGTPRRQKTVQAGARTVSLIEEKDGSFTLSTTDDLYTYSWTKREITLPFAPDISSLTATDDRLWMLDSAGSLYSTDDMSVWTDTGEKWSTMLGGYTGTVVGLRTSGGVTEFAQYPLTNLKTKEIPSDFPITGTSNLVTLANKWTSSPVAFFTGGVMADGTYSDITWAFDGSEWVQLGKGGIPALEGASVIPYYNYRPSSDGKTMIEYSVWMLLGGRKADGEFNRTVYISYNNGVNWATGATSLQLPEEIPAMVGVDNVVASNEMSANISDAWKKTARGPARIKVETVGDVVIWECPYIYLFGGYAPDGTLYDTIWQGVLTRLTFTPII
ncbi:MAG: hypothetical protein K2L59_09930 [Muribaculaceae bacterium]|nr:hypothetical protein [Muribaculaceae bacterium]